MMELKLKYSWEGFAKVNVVHALVSSGYSHIEAKRLFKNGAIKVWDTKVTNDGSHFVWFKRKASLIELIERNERAMIIVGHHKFIDIVPVPFNLGEQVYYHLRDIVNQIKDTSRNRGKITEAKRSGKN